MTTQYTKNFALALPDFRQGPWHDLINGDLTKLDAIIYSAMSQGNVAPWTNITHYTVGITVIDSVDASVWMCAVDHTSAALPTTFAQDRTNHPTYWARLLTGFAPRGEWTRSTQYFPYDLAYDSGRGIMALCTTKHISTSTGSIVDDQAYWTFLLDMSDVGTVTANAVTYSNLASSIPKTNVQDAIDYLETQIVGLNNVNITQGNQITAIQTLNTTQDGRLTSLESRMSAVEAKNTTQDTLLAGLRTDVNTALAKPAGIPSGTIMCFFQQVVPTGWNQINGWSDRAIRLFDANGGGGTAGGAIGWSGCFDPYRTTDGHAITLSEMPYHDHGSIPANTPWTSGGFVNAPGINYVAGVGARTDAQGGNAAHTHTIDMRIAYIGACVGQKQ